MHEVLIGPIDQVVSLTHENVPEEDGPVTAHSSAEAPSACEELEHDGKIQGPTNGDTEPRRTLLTSFAHRTTWARSFSGSLFSCSASRPPFS